jgi:hypothetical protein
MKPPMRSELEWRARRVASRVGVRVLRRAGHSGVGSGVLAAGDERQAARCEAHVACDTHRHGARRRPEILPDLFARTLRRVAGAAGLLVLLAGAARAADGAAADAGSIGAEQSTATGTDQLPVHVLDQSDPSQYQEVWSWSTEWRVLPWYVQALVLVAGVLLLFLLWCATVVAAGAWKLARARHQLARAQCIEAAADAAFVLIDEHRRRLERELGRAL